MVLAKKVVLLPMAIGLIGTVTALTINWEHFGFSPPANEALATIFEEPVVQEEPATDWSQGAQPEELAGFLPVSITSINVCIDTLTGDTTMTVEVDGLPTGTTPGVDDDYYIIVNVPVMGGGNQDLQSNTVATAGPTGTFTIDVDAGTPNGAMISGNAVLTQVVQDPDDSDGAMGPCPCVLAIDNTPFAFTAGDVTPPVISCPMDVTIECSADTSATANGMATATDDCDAMPSITRSDLITAGGCTHEYLITRTWVAHDQGGNTANCEQHITVEDNTAPVLNCPSDTTVECNAVPAADPMSVTATDNCDMTLTVVHDGDAPAGPYTGCSTIVTRTYKATDDCGNTGMCTQTITVEDTTDPVINCPANTTVECNAVPIADFTGGSAADNCDPTPTVTHQGDAPAGPYTDCSTTVTRTYRATDVCGNFAECTQTITVEDTTDPVIDCPADVTVECDEITMPANTGSATATDNCDAVPSISSSDAVVAGVCPQEEVITRTWTAEDDCGNSSNCDQVITVEDTQAPSLTCPSDITVECNAVPAADPMSVTATDNCDMSLTVVHSLDNPAGPYTACTTTVDRVYEATDDCGNTGTCTQTITVEDTTDPMITCPADVTISVDAAMCSSNGAIGTPTVSDNCTPMGSLTPSVMPAAPYPLGTNTVTWSVSDVCGNSASCNQVVTVVTDLMADAGTDTEVCDGFSTAIGGAPTASGGGGTYSYLWDNAATLDDATLANPTATPTATTTYTVTVTDNFGCTATDQVTVTVNPNPTASIDGVTPMCAAVTLTFDGNPSGGTPGYTHSWSSSAPAVATVSDNGDGTADVTAVAGGTTTITYTVTDSKGCTATATFTLNVPMSCDPEFNIYDPCECIDDADVNGDNGTFRETVIITGPGGAALPAGMTWSVDDVTGAHQPDLTNNAGPNPAMITVGQTMIYCNVPGGCNLDGDPDIEVPQGGYYLYLEHVDNQGYSVTVEGPNAPGDPTNVFLSQSNLCFYPEPQILGIQDLCENSAPITLTGAVSTTGTGTFNGNAFYLGPGYGYNAAPGLTDNGDGTATFDPAAAGPGCHTISYTFTDNPGAGTAEPGCVSVIEATLFVYPEDDPTFTVTAPNCPGDVKALQLDNALIAWPTPCSGTAPTNGERVRWYGGDGTNVTVVDNGGAGSADATGTLTISATATPGTYTVCAEAGIDPCKSTYCFDVVVSPNYTAGDADLIPNTSICLAPNEVFSFQTLLESGSALGGTFTAALGGGATGTILPNGFVYGGGDGTLTVTYTLTNCDGSFTSDMVTLTIDEMPDGAFSLPTSVCQDSPNATAVITGVPAGASVNFVSNPVGFINNAVTGEFDPDGGAVAGESVNVDVTMTVSNGVCPDHTFDQYVVVNASGDPAFTLQNTICQTAAALVLSLTNPNNDGGQPLLADNITWTGTGVTDNGLTGTFDPSGLAPGDYTVCVTVGSPSCEETECHDIEVQKDYTAAEVALTNDYSICMQPGEVISFSDLLSATALPGGQFSVNDPLSLGVASANNWQYLGSGCGSITVTYSFVDDCDPNNDAVTITIEQRPDIGAISNVGPLCATDAAVNVDYSGTPFVCGGTFGTFSGPGVTDNGDGATASFDPAAAGEGTHTILYTLIPPSGICDPVLVSSTIEVRASSDPTFSLPDEVCIADGPWALTLGNPDASVDAGSPDGVAEVVWFGALGTVDVTDNVGNDPTGSFHPSQPGTYTICVTTGDPDCAQTYCQDIIVHEDAVIPTTCYSGTVGVELPCAADNTGTNHTYTVGSTTINSTYNIHTFDLEGLLCPGTSTGGSWSFNVANTDGAILGTNLYYTAPGCYMVEYTVDKPGASCDATQVFVVRVGEDPQPALDIPEEWCWDGGDGDPVVTFDIPDYITSPSYAGTVTRSYTSSNPAVATVDAAGTVTTTGWGQSTICMTEVLETAACGGFAASTCTNTVCQVINVQDDVNPEAECKTIVVDLDAMGGATITPADVDNGSSDNCDQTLTMAINVSNFECLDLGYNMVILTVTDDNGNSDQCMAQVLVRDVTAPMLTCPGAGSVELSPTGTHTFELADFPGLTATDNCGGLEYTFTPPIVYCEDAETTVDVVVVVNDASGNEDQCTIPTFVDDVTAPPVTGVCHDITIEFDYLGNAAINPDDIAGIVDDECGQITLISVLPNTWSGCVSVGTHLVELTYEDNNGNLQTCGAIVTIEDNLKPDLECKASANVVLDATTGCTTIDTSGLIISLYDNCGIERVDFEDMMTGALSQTVEFCCDDLGLNSVTIKAKDNNNNLSYCTVAINVIDDTAPVIDCTPLQRTHTNDPGVCAFTMPGTGFDILVTAPDNCPPVTLKHNYAPAPSTSTLAGATFPVGITIVDWTATDHSGNVSMCSVEITITDDEAPTVTTCPANISVDADPTTCGADISYAVPTFADNCDGNGLLGTLTSGYAPGTEFPLGTTTVTWEYTDLAGNGPAVCTFTVTVTDNVAPVAMCQNAYTVSLDESGDFEILVADINVASWDNCGLLTRKEISRDGVTFGGSVLVDCNDAGNSVTVTLEVEDQSGNTDQCVTIVSVVDDQVPDIECPGNFTVLNDAGQCSAVVTYNAPSVTDNCTYTVSQTDGTGLTSGDAFPVGTTVQSYMVVDASGNTESCSFEITVLDEEPPVVDCTPLVRTQNNDAGLCSFTMPGAGFDATATDNCPGMTFTHDYGPAVSNTTLAGSTFPVGITEVVWTATDAAGNHTSCTVTIVINDTEAPTNTTCPADIVQGTDADACGADITYALPTFADNCDGTGLFGTLTSGYASGTEFPIGTTTVTWEYTDLAGNGTAVCTFTVTITDDDAPVAVCNPDYTVALDGDGTFDIPASDIDLNSYDNCDVVSTGISRDGDPFSGSVLVDCDDIGGAGFGLVTITMEVADAAGNTSQCTTEITVFDLQIPDIECPGNFTVLTDAGQCSAVVNYNPPSVTDNCSTTLVQTDLTGLTSGDAFPVGTTVQSYMVTDVAGNTESCSFEITVIEEESPVIDCGPTVRTQVADAGLCSFTMPGAGFDPTATDNCPGVIITHNYANAVDPHTLAGSTFPVGTTLVTWIAQDASGNTSDICGIEIVVVDDQNPTISCGADQSVDTDAGECSYKVTSTALDPAYTDNCPDAVLSHDYAMAPNSNSLNGATFPVGTTTVTFTVTDASGNTATCSMDITVTDNEAPVYVNCPVTTVMIGNDPDECSGKLNWSIPVAEDNCEIATNEQTAGLPSGSVVPVGTASTVTYTATDVHGNTSTCSFDIMVVDTQDPEFDADIVMPGDITVECDAVPAAFVLTNDDVHDNCTAPADLVIVFTETSTQDADENVCGHYNYTITRTWEITDEAGNTTTHVQIITVQDTQAPVPSCTDQTLTLDLFGNATLDPVAAAAGTTDNCAPFSALTITASQTDFNCDDLGETSVTITISDPCGNTTTCTITVTVVEGEAPCVPEYDFNGSDPCVCLNNATDLSNGQFSELIQIHALAGQTWTVASSTGLYMASSPAPPAAPIPVANGTQLTPGDMDGLDNDNDGSVDEADEIQYYTLSARHVDGQGFMATLQNNLQQSVEFMNTCYYPTPLFTNLDQDFCLSTPPFEPEVTDQYAGNGAYNSVVFTVNGVVTNTIDPGALGIGNHVVTATVDAGTAKPARKVNGVPVPGDAVGTDGRLDPGCEQTITTFINVVTTPSQVTCNNLVQVSIEQGCESVVTPDMVLEGTYPCFDDYSVVIKDAAGVPLSPPNVVTAAHATQTLTAYLVHPISGNVCWGMLLIEDKLPPVLTCPDDVTIMCTEDPDKKVAGKLVTGEPGVDECSNWSRQYTDDYTQFDCADNPGIAEVIVRTFVVSDEFGNQSTCEHTITKVRGEADQVVWPTDKDYNCTSVPGSLQPNVTGWPKIAGFDLTTTGTGICGLGVSYVDQTVNLCPGSYKIVRTWTIFDWCPAQGGAPTQTSYVQYIKVLDLPPSISVTCNDVDPATGYCILNATEPPIAGHNVCRTFGPIPFAQIDGVCNNVVEVTVETPAGNTINGGYIPGDGLPLGGPYEIVYRAEDECGNITQYTLTVIVQDIVAPTVVCDEITDANLSIDGIATLFAETFDDGTTDNCCLDHFEVRRMEDNCDDGHDDTVFGESVVFCCNDIPGPHTVVFRAYDCHGNYNECMVQVNVSDKLKPDLLTCPAPQRVTCDWYADNLETQLADLAGDADAQSQLLDQYFGAPTFQDNCDLDINRTINVNIDQCLEGTITRSWSAEDPSGNVSNQCTQTVFVDHVSDWVVEFPASLTVTCGNDVPDFGEPKIFNETCELVAVSYVDEVFNTVPDACYKILRTWTVINWCVVGDDIDEEVVETPENALGLPFPACDLDGDGDCDDRTFRDSWNASSKPTAANATDTTNPDTDLDSDPWDGFITYQQTIKVIDDVDPVFTNGCDIPNVCIEDNTCGATVTLPQPEITECSSIVTLTASGDLGTGFGPFVNVAPGTYSVTYNAKDNCNNQTVCEATVTVEDCKKPTPYCVNGLVIDLMNTVPAMVEVWASDFDAGSFDNCDDNLELSLSADVNDKSRIYTCDDLGQQIVQLWVTDDAGNQDYCETFIIIQANMGQCDTTGTPLITGVIETEGAEPVADVDVQLSGSNQSNMMTGNDGQYGFAVTTGGDYTVTPVKDVDPLNGVTTFDLVLITKHILGVQSLDSPYKMIAADANKSKSITTFDLVQLRKLILFIDTEFPANTSWRFVDKAYVFPDPTNPWVEEFPEVINFNNVTADELDSDFIAVKVGDVNGSAQPNFASSAEDRTVTGSLVFDIDDVELENGALYTVNFKARDFNVLGYQFTLNYDRTALEFVQVEPALANNDNFGLTLLDKGAITTSWNENNVKLENGEVVFSLTFKANRKVKLSEALSVNSRFTPAEAYKPNGDLLDVELAFNGALAGTFELYQNTPNPFSAETVIGFNLPQASTATLTITDVSGKVVKVLTGDYAKGYNEIKLKRSELPAGGIFYYQLDTPTDSATKMMLLVD